MAQITSNDSDTRIEDDERILNGLDAAVEALKAVAAAHPAAKEFIEEISVVALASRDAVEEDLSDAITRLVRMNDAMQGRAS